MLQLLMSNGTIGKFVLTLCTMIHYYWKYYSLPTNLRLLLCCESLFPKTYDCRCVVPFETTRNLYVMTTGHNKHTTVLMLPTYELFRHQSTTFNFVVLYRFECQCENFRGSNNTTTACSLCRRLETAWKAVVVVIISRSVAIVIASSRLIDRCVVYCNR